MNEVSPAPPHAQKSRTIWGLEEGIRKKKHQRQTEDEFEDDFGRKGRGLRQGLGDAMWITHLFPLICRKQRKTHGALIHFREVKETR